VVIRALTVCCNEQPLQLSVAKVAINLKLFEILVAHGQTASVAELAHLTGAQDLLLRRGSRVQSQLKPVDNK
jgi:hypothetical protein